MAPDTSLFTHSTNIKDFYKQSSSYYWQSRLSDFKILSIDPNCVNVIGYTADEIMADPSIWQKSIYKDDVSRIQEARNSLKEKKFIDIEFRAIRKDGNEIWLNNKYFIISLPNANDEYFAGITIDITESKKAEKFLHNRLKLDEIISSTSASFVDIKTHEFDEHVNDVLRKIGEFADIDRSYVFIYDGELMHNTHEWVKEGISEEKDNLQNIPTEYLPWSTEVVKRDDVIYYYDINDLPPEAAPEKETLEAQNIKSVLWVPMRSDDRVIGFMGFDAVTEHILWSPDDIKLLRTIAEITSRAFVRREEFQKLSESELKFRQVAENIKEVFYLTDPVSQKLLYISNAFEDIWGVTAEFLYENMPYFVESVLPEYKEKVIQSLEDQANGHFTDIEYKIRRPDGTERWIRDRSYPIFDEQGKVVRVSGIADDITKYKVTEEQIRNSEELYRSLIESADGSILVFDRKLHITFANSIAVEKINTWLEPNKTLSLGDILNKKFNDFLPEYVSEQFNAMIQKVFDEGVMTLEESKTIQHGEEIYNRNSIVPIRGIHNEIKYVLLNAIDITDSVKSREIIKRSNNRLKGLQQIYKSLLEGGFKDSPAELEAIYHLNNLLPCDEINLVVFDDKSKNLIVNTKSLQNEEIISKELNLDKDLNIPFSDFEKIFIHTNLRYHKSSTESGLFNKILTNTWDEVHVFPLSVYGEKLGVLLLSCNSFKEFSDETLEIAEEASSQIALSIYHKKVYEKMQSYNEELEREVQDRTREILSISNLYSSIMNNTDISIIILNSEGELEECNPATKKYLKLNEGQLVKGEKIEFIHDPIRKNACANELLSISGKVFTNVFDMFNYKIKNRLPNTFEWVYKKSDGQTLPVLLTINTINTINESNKYVLIASDISEQKASELRLMQTLNREIELGKFKSTFVTTASHQFRTPLTSMQTSVELIDMYMNDIDIPKKPAIQNHLGRINIEIKKLGDLMSDILTIGKIDEGKVPSNKEEVDVNEMIVDLLGSYFSNRPDNRIVEFNNDNNASKLFIDKRLLSHAIINLLTNAFKYSAGNPILNLSEKDDKVNIEIIDNGIGIPKHEIDNLFQSFYRASNASNIEGTGLGLVIVKEFVNINGGEIYVDSEVNKGSKFTIVLNKNAQ